MVLVRCGETMILTAGHSTRSLEELRGLLQAHGVELLVDIRTIPRSRRNPQFNLESLPSDLQAVGIDYIHMAGLGGLRRPRPDSINRAWENASFRGYADYMQTPEFEENINVLLRTTAGRQACIMCAEAVPWRCHRSLVADYLAARGVAVEHIMSATRRQPHRVTRFCVIANGRVTYPGERSYRAGDSGVDLQSE
jgi:uncharacterized protein (DUF488 family)